MKKLSILGVTTLTILTLVACTGTNSVKEGQSSKESGVVSTSSSPQKGVSNISANKAKSIALSEVGVSEKEVVNLVVREDSEDGQAVFDVQFVLDGTEYEFTISATDGSIVESSQEVAEDHVMGSAAAEAKKVVFSDAGVTEKGITNLVVENDTTDYDAQIRQVIEIEFDFDGKEFSYTVDAKTMEILEKEVEIID